MKNFSWKHLNSKIKLISATIVILMVVQMLILIIVSNNRQTEHYNSQAREEFSNSTTEMDETLEYLKESILAFSQQKDVYSMFFSERINRQQVQNFKQATLLTPSKISSLINNIYIYNQNTNTIYADNMSETVASKLPDSLTKEMILSRKTSKRQLNLFVDTKNFLFKTNTSAPKQCLRICYFPSKQIGSCILVDVSIHNIMDAFESYKKNFPSDIFITDQNTVFYGTDTGNLHKALEQKLTQLSEKDFNYPVFETLNGKKYLVHKQTDKSNFFNVYSLIPDNAISSAHPETQIMFSINGSLIIMLCLAGVIFLLFKNFHHTVLENTRLKTQRFEEQLNKQFVRKKECLINCLAVPGETDLQAAAEYIHSQLQSKGKPDVPDLEKLEMSLLRIEIDNYKSFEKAHTSQDIRLYKYGITNICEEILNTHTTAILVYEKNEEIVFLIINNDNYVDNCRKGIEECRNAVTNYINTDLFAFLSNSGNLSSLPQLNKQTIELAEYIFTLDNPCFLTADSIKEGSKIMPSEAIEMLDPIFNTTDESARDLKLNAFFDTLSNMRPEDAKNVLWIFMFRLYNTGKRNPESTYGIEEMVTQFNEIQKLSEMYEFFTNLYSTVFPTPVSTALSAQDNIVLTVQAIIERDFREPNFCCDNIADEMNSSKVYLSRKYKSFTGNSISEEILARRLKAFEHELVTTNKRIKNIITDIGGANYNYYMALFKKHFSMTPTEYRKKYHHNSDDE